MSELTATNKTALIELSNQLNIIASRLAGVDCILRLVADTGSLSYQIANSLSLVGGMTDRLNSEICDIADKVHIIADPSE